MDVPDKDGNTLLHFAAAAKDGSYNLVKELSEDISKGQINFQNKKGQSPLHIAYQYNNIEAAYLLEIRGADTTIRDNEGKTPKECLGET